MPRYIYKVPVEFRLKEKIFSLSNDSFSIKRLDTGRSVFKVKGNAFSIRDSKKMYSNSGKALFKMTESIVSMRSRMHIQDTQSGRKYTIRRKGVIPLLGTSTVYVWKGSSSGGRPWLEIKGNVRRKTFQIKRASSGKKVATVRRQGFNFRNLVADKQTYIIRVQPGQDAALLIFLVVAIDENYREAEEN